MEAQQISKKTVTEALIEAMEKAGEMDRVLIIWAKDNPKGEDQPNEAMWHNHIDSDIPMDQVLGLLQLTKQKVMRLFDHED